MSGPNDRFFSDGRRPCFACGAPIGASGAARAHTADGQNVLVGSSCWQKILSASTDARGGEHTGYQPLRGGPRLWAGWIDDEELAAFAPASDAVEAVRAAARDDASSAAYAAVLWRGRR